MKLIPLIRSKTNSFLILLCVYVLWLLSVKNRQTGGMDDFDIFFKAGERLLNGENIYGPPHYYNLKYFYSVLFAGIMALLQWMDINTVKWFWFILNTTLFVRVYFLIKEYILSVGPRGSVVFFFLLLISGKMVLVNYTFNQISVLILWTMFESLHQLLKGRITLAVFILCLGINIKIMPVVLVPYFLLISDRFFKVLFTGIGFLLLFTFLPAFFIGWEYNNLLLSEWWKTLNPVSEIHVMQTYEYGFTDVSSMVTKFLSGEAVYNEPQLNIADLPMNILFIITNAIRVAFLAAVVYMAVKLKGKAGGIDKRIIISSAFMALIPLCFPHQREYSFMFSIPSLAVLMTLIQQRAKTINYIIFISLVMLAGLMIWVDFAGQELTDIFKHYRLITMGMSGILIFYISLVLKTYRDAKLKSY